jgi:hypothetical protein
MRGFFCDAAGGAEPQAEHEASASLVVRARLARIAEQVPLSEPNRAATTGSGSVGE